MAGKYQTTSIFELNDLKEVIDKLSSRFNPSVQGICLNLMKLNHTVPKIG